MKCPKYIPSVRASDKVRVQEKQNTPGSKTSVNKEVALKPALCASFHGESWYKCPTCGESFEFYDAFFNGSRCPHCKQHLDQS